MKFNHKPLCIGYNFQRQFNFGRKTNCSQIFKAGPGIIFALSSFSIYHMVGEYAFSKIDKVENAFNFFLACICTVRAASAPGSSTHVSESKFCLQK